nr:ORF3 [Torque teno virus]
MPWRPPVHSVQGREDQWFASFFHGHASFCGCGDAVGHLNSIAPRFPRAGPPRPPPGLEQPNPPQQGPAGPGGPPAILALPAPPAEPDDPQPRRGGGDGGAAAGAAGDRGDRDYDEEELDELFRAAAEDDLEPTRFPTPISTLASYKCRTRNCSDRGQCSTSGTSDVGSLAKEVLKECQNTHRMMNLLRQVSHQSETSSTRPSEEKTQSKKNAILSSKHSRKKRPQKKKNQHPKKKPRKRSYSTSSSSRDATSESSDEGSSSSLQTSSDSARESTGTPSSHRAPTLHTRPTFSQYW